jgi:predicted acetyltransferase
MGNKWKNNTDSPVLFLIDDFTNRWADINDDGKITTEEDWDMRDLIKMVHLIC